VSGPCPEDVIHVRITRRDRLLACYSSIRFDSTASAPSSTLRVPFHLPLSPYPTSPHPTSPTQPHHTPLVPPASPYATRAQRHPRHAIPTRATTPAPPHHTPAHSPHLTKINPTDATRASQPLRRHLTPPRASPLSPSNPAPTHPRHPTPRHPTRAIPDRATPPAPPHPAQRHPTPRHCTRATPPHTTPPQPTPPAPPHLLPELVVRCRSSENLLLVLCIVLSWGLECRPICTSCPRSVIKSLNS